MLDVAILGQVALGYSPFIDRNRTVAATRLSVFPLRPDATLDVAQLLHAVGDVWPASGGRVSLNVVSESLLHDLLRAEPSVNLMVEVPNFMASDPANVDALTRLHGAGNTLLLKGRPNAELPREVLPCFKYSIIDIADDRRIGGSPVPDGVTRTIEHVQSGVRTVADMEASFARGAHAVLGWPIDDAINAT
ncbi:MAG: histidine kinase, partial [Caldimonas sp.]